MDRPRIIRPGGRGMAPDLSHLRRGMRQKPPAKIEVVLDNDPRLLKGIRPELQILAEHLPQAARGEVLGVNLTAMSRDELLALCAMLIAANKGEDAPEAEPPA